MRGGWDVRVRTVVVWAPRCLAWWMGLFIAAGPLCAGPVFPLRVAAPEVRSASETPALTAALDQAFFSFQRHRFDECYERLLRARQQRPELPPPRLMLARFHLAQNEVAPGRLALEQAAGDEPEYPGCYLTLGELALAEGRWTDAWLHFRQVLQLTSAGRTAAARRPYFSQQAHAGLAAVAERRRDWKAAQVHLEAWLAAEPKIAVARERLARVRFLAGDEEGAFEQLQRAAQDDPAIKTAETNMGLLFLEKKDLAKATQWMRRAVSAAPGDARAHLELGFCLASQDKLQDARQSAAAAAKIDPERKELKVLQGLIGLRSGDYQNAERQYQALLNEFPEDHLARDQLAVALAEQESEEKRRRAVELAQINARLFPDSPGALATLGWTYYRTGRLAEAERALRAAVRTTANPNTLYFLATVLIDLGQSDEAKTLLENAVKSSPGDLTFRSQALERLKQLGGGLATEGARP